jgi:hypothetical protein
MKRKNDTSNDASSAAMLDALETFTAKLAKGRKAPADDPVKLPVRSIKTEPTLFQPRSHGGWRNRNHIEGLAASMRSGQEVNGMGGVEEPVTVLWNGSSWTCIDGHHRLEALKVELKVGIAATVRVTVFRGSVTDAMLRSSQGNSRNKLEMTKSEKAAQAWRMFLLQKWTQNVIALACDVNTRTVGRMAKAVRELGSTPDGLAALRERPWGDVNRELLGGGGDDADDEPLRLEEKLQQRITKQAVALGKAVKDSSPMVVGAALLAHDPDFALEVARYVQRMAEEQSAAERMQEEYGCNPLVLGNEF